MVRSLINKHCHDESGSTAVMAALKRVFDQHAVDTISDEHLRRVLEPVRRAIWERRFGRPQKLSWSGRSAGRMLKVATDGAVVSVAMVLVQSKLVYGSGPKRDIRNHEGPLFETPVMVNVLTGWVSFEGKGLGGIALTLVDADGMKVYANTVSGADGAYAFIGMPDGSYRMRASLHGDMKVANTAALDGKSPGNGHDNKCNTDE